MFINQENIEKATDKDLEEIIGNIKYGVKFISKNSSMCDFVTYNMYSGKKCIDCVLNKKMAVLDGCVTITLLRLGYTREEIIQTKKILVSHLQERIKKEQLRRREDGVD